MWSSGHSDRLGLRELWLGSSQTPPPLVFSFPTDGTFSIFKTLFLFNTKGSCSTITWNGSSKVVNGPNLFAMSTSVNSENSPFNGCPHQLSPGCTKVEDVDTGIPHSMDKDPIFCLPSTHWGQYPICSSPLSHPPAISHSPWPVSYTHLTLPTKA